MPPPPSYSRSSAAASSAFPTAATAATAVTAATATRRGTVRPKGREGGGGIGRGGGGGGTAAAAAAAALGPVSAADILLFKRLANPNVVDMPSEVPALLRLERRRGNSPVAAAAEPARGGKSIFDAYVKDAAAAVLSPRASHPHPLPGGNDDEEEDEDDDDDEDDDVGDEDMEEEEEEGDEGDEEEDEEETAAAAVPPSRSRRKSPPPSSSSSILSSRSSPSSYRGGSGSRGRRSDRTEAHIRQAIALSRLQSLKAQGGCTEAEAAEFAKLPVHQLEIQLDLINERQNSASTIAHFKMCISFVMRTIEMINSMILRDFFPLKGWTDHHERTTPHVFDAALYQIYQRYSRNGMGSPWMSIIFAMGVSGASFMFMRYLQGPSSSPAAAAAPNSAAAAAAAAAAAPPPPPLAATAPPPFVPQAPPHFAAPSNAAPPNIRPVFRPPYASGAQGIPVPPPTPAAAAAARG